MQKIQQTFLFHDLHLLGTGKYRVAINSKYELKSISRKVQNMIRST